MMGSQQGHGSGVKINSGRASAYFVLGVLNTQGLRNLVVESTMGAAKKKQRQALDPAIIGAYDGEKATPEQKLWMWCRPLTADKAESKAAIPKLLEFLDAKQLLLLSTHAGHTTLVQLSSQVGDAEPANSWPRQWEVCIYDSLNPHPKLDGPLQKGVTLFLETTGAKKTGTRGHFKHTAQPVRIKQDDAIVCALMAIIRLMVKLTGEPEPEPAQWHSCADWLRTFFDLWFFMEAEDRGAVRRGFLQEVLLRAVSSGAGAPGPSREVRDAIVDECGNYVLVRSAYTNEKGTAAPPARTRAKVIERIEGRGCRFPVGDEKCALDCLARHRLAGTASPGERLVLRFSDRQSSGKASSC